MKSGGATLMRCFLVGVMPLMGASMKTMKEIGQALSMDGSFFDHGLGGDDLNLQVIESSLMSMVREGTSPSLRPGIEAIYNLTTDMKAAVENKSNQEQMNLTDDWYEWLNCSPSNDGGNDFGPKQDQVRQYCQVSDKSWALVDWEGNLFNGTTEEWFYTHCRHNCTQVCEYENEIASQSCPQSPFSCEKQWAAFDDNTDVRAHMAYLQSVFAQGMILEPNCSTPNCTSQCRTDCPGESNFSSRNCSESVCRFENEGCKLQRDACAAYEICYYQKEQEYNQTKNFTLAQEIANKQEYRAILRIECLLDKFLASIDSNQSLSAGLDSCINTTFDVNDQTYFGNVTIHYYNESENPLKTCNTENFPNYVPSFSVPPGSSAWQIQYYAPYIAAGLEPPICTGDPSLQALVPDCVVVSK